MCKEGYYSERGESIKKAGNYEIEARLSLARDGSFLHQKLHYHFGGVGNRGARAEDGGNAGFVEEVIVLRGDDTTGGDHDIRTAEFLSSSMTCGMRVL